MQQNADVKDLAQKVMNQKKITKQQKPICPMDGRIGSRCRTGLHGNPALE